MSISFYFLIGTAWTFFIDKFSSTKLKLPPMTKRETVLQIIVWPVGMTIFSFTLLAETFRKKN